MKILTNMLLITALVSVSSITLGQSLTVGNQNRTNNTDSTMTNPSLRTEPLQRRTMCPKITVGDTPITKAGNTIQLTPSGCQDLGSGGGIGWWLHIFNRTEMGPSCTSERPYLSSYSEVWEGTMTGGFANITNHVCCAAPAPPQISIQAGYKADSTGTVVYDRWFDDDCP